MTETKEDPTLDILLKLSDGEKVKISDVDDIRSEIAQWVVNIGTFLESLESVKWLGEVTLPENLHELGRLKRGVFIALPPAIDTCRNAFDAIEEILRLCDDFTAECGQFEDHAEVWCDRERDRDERSEARGNLNGIATELCALLAKVKAVGIDPDEPNGIGE